MYAVLFDFSVPCPQTKILPFPVRKKSGINIVSSVASFIPRII